MTIRTQFLQIGWIIVQVITIYVIHVGDNLGPFLLNQLPVGITAESQINTSIIITTDASP
jgi:hypothetical protein